VSSGHTHTHTHTPQTRTHTDTHSRACMHARTHTNTKTHTHYCTCKRCPTITGWLPLALDRVKWQDLVNTIMTLQVTKHAWNFLTSWGSISFTRVTVLVWSTRGLNVQVDANDAQPNMLQWTQLPHLSLTLNSTSCSSLSSARSIQYCQEHNHRNGRMYYNVFHFLLFKWVQ
jgi:hypothetical protein